MVTRWPQRRGRARQTEPQRPSARRRPPQAPDPRAGRGRGTGGARACTPAGPESRSAGPLPSLTAGRGRTPRAGPRGRGHAAPARPSTPTRAGSPRSPEARRVSYGPHVVSKQPAAPTCPGKPRSGCLPIGSPHRSARPTLLLIGRESGSRRIGTGQQRGRGFLKGCGLCREPGRPARNRKPTGAERVSRSRSRVCPPAPIHPAAWVGMWPPTSCVPLNAERLTEGTPAFAEWELIASTSSRSWGFSEIIDMRGTEERFLKSGLLLRR